MNRFMKTVLVAASIATAGIATTSTASAGGANFSITIGNGGPGGGNWGGPRRNRGVCTPHKALKKARRMGIRHARVVNTNRKVVKVSGRNRGHRVNAVFGNTSRCPVVRFR